MSKKTFKRTPWASWEWAYDFMKAIDGCEPNQAHKAIREFQEFCHKSKDTDRTVETVLITQNIDDLHGQEIRESDILMNAEEDSFEEEDETEISFQPHVYEIYGNIRYMHCSNEKQKHSNDLLVAPTPDEAGTYRENLPYFGTKPRDKILIPKCLKCGGVMKPHCNYSDKAYTITYSRSKAMFEFVDNSDCLLVIGTGLETSFTKSIIEAFLDR